MRTATAFVLALALPAIPAGAASHVSLAGVAAAHGYAMRWLAPERSVSLTRNGTVIVLRPGSVLFDVNTHVETTDLPPVATSTGDLLISARLASRLRALGRQNISSGAPTGQVLHPLTSASGAIVVDTRLLAGRNALSVEGSAPRNARVTLTLLATLAPDLPTVLLERNDVQADVNGRFSALVSLAPDYLGVSTVTLVATADDASPVSVRVLVDRTQ